MNRWSLSRLAPIALVALVVALSAIVAYHALDSWYLQTANASRLRADYSAVAAVRFRNYATVALHEEIAKAVESARSGARPKGKYAPPFVVRIPLSGPSSVFPGDALAQADVQAIVDGLRAGAAAARGGLRSIRSAHIDTPGGDWSMMYTLTADASGDFLIVGFPYQPSSYASLFAELFATRRLLHPGMYPGQDNQSAFTLRIADADGRVIFESGTFGPNDYVSRDTLSRELGGLVVTAAARKSAAAWLATEHLASRMALILSLVILSALASIATVRIMGRETKLARLRSDFVSSVSHELRTPLSQIQIFLETLRLGRFSTDDQRDWILGGMQREITRLTTLVNNVLHFSLSGRGKLRSLPSQQPMELAPFLGQIIADFDLLARARSARIETDLAPGVIVSISPDTFRQVMLNLLDNALKYGPEGQTIRVSTMSESAQCRILVDDEGPGVPVGERTQVWKPFYRGSNVLGTTAAGSGIGLAVVHEIVAAHGGSVTVTDAPRGGARFVIELPTAHPAAESMPAHASIGNAS